MNQISVIGIGLDGKLGLTTITKEIINRATIIIGAKRHLSYFTEHSAVKITLNINNLQQDIDLVISKAITKENVVILASGDPLFFGLGRLLLSKIAPKDLQFYPHLCSIQLAFSKLKIPWQDANLVSVHGRNCDRLLQLLKQGVDKIAVLTDNVNHPKAIAKLYLSLELPVAYSFHICENLTVTEGELSTFAPSEISHLANSSEIEFAALNVLVLIKEETKENQLDVSQLPLLGIPDSAFLSFSDRPSLITKKEVRTVILAELALQANQIVWDIGAGTGSVAIEIARLAPTTQVYAIEKTAMGISLIKENSQRFAVTNIYPISQKAPQSLTQLPTPNRIFIGGSGGDLLSILNTCQEKIAASGIIVIALATIEHLATVIQWAQQNNWQYNLLQVQISRSTPIADLTRFSPLNPVTIIKLISRV